MVHEKRERCDMSLWNKELSPVGEEGVITSVINNTT